MHGRQQLVRRGGRSSPPAPHLTDRRRRFSSCRYRCARSRTELQIRPSETSSVMPHRVAAAVDLFRLGHDLARIEHGTGISGTAVWFAASHDCSSRVLAAQAAGMGSPKLDTSPRSSTSTRRSPMFTTPSRYRRSSRSSQTLAAESRRSPASETHARHRRPGRRFVPPFARPAIASGGRRVPGSNPNLARRFSAGTTAPRENTTPSMNGTRVGYRRHVLDHLDVRHVAALNAYVVPATVKRMNVSVIGRRPRTLVPAGPTMPARDSVRACP